LEGIPICPLYSLCTEHSLEGVRRHWLLYLNSQTLTSLQKNAIRNSVLNYTNSTLQKHRGILGSSRSVGPFVYGLGDQSKQTYERFWTTGSFANEAQKFLHTNPTFVYSLSGSTFNVHYGTDPLAAFHLSSVVTSKPQHVTTEDLIENAKEQFCSWISSFRKRVSVGSSANLTIRFFAGESLAFCRALQIRKEAKIIQTGVYTYQWGGSQIAFDSEDYGTSSTSLAPVSFNVIETSNLTDHTGLLNVLLATIPLLQQKPWSVIYTNALLLTNSALFASPNVPVLAQLARVDIPTLSLCF